MNNEKIKNNTSDEKKNINFVILQNEYDKGIIVKNVKDFNIMQTLECGQCFHYDKIGEMEYVVVHKKSLLHIRQSGKDLYCKNITKEEFENIWFHYFDLDRDYSMVKDMLLKADERLESAIRANDGVRILNQDFDETLMSFIISQNKQIPHIKKIVRDISEKYGDCLGGINGVNYYAFPNKSQLQSVTEENYRECKAGFRAPYLVDAAEKICREEFESKNLKEDGYEKAKERLMSIKGVGDKVANCVLLFSLGYRNAFPVDVWIKRIMESMYFGKSTDNKKIMEFAKEKFGVYGGYAQQYLFYYARENQLNNSMENKKSRKRQKK